jgi:hypothetical protein
MIEAAWAAFADAYPSRTILKNLQLRPRQGTDGSYVVAVVYDSNTKPPFRTWWRFAHAESPAEAIPGWIADQTVGVRLWK